MTCHGWTCPELADGIPPESPNVDSVVAEMGHHISML